MVCLPSLEVIIFELFRQGILLSISQVGYFLHLECSTRETGASLLVMQGIYRHLYSYCSCKGCVTFFCFCFVVFQNSVSKHVVGIYLSICWVIHLFHFLTSSCFISQLSQIQRNSFSLNFSSPLGRSYTFYKWKGISFCFHFSSPLAMTHTS